MRRLILPLIGGMFVTGAAWPPCQSQPAETPCADRPALVTLVHWTQPSFAAPPLASADAGDWDGPPEPQYVEAPPWKPPKVQLGNAKVSVRHRKEVTLTQDCWQLTLRAFSKIELYCKSSF